MTVSPTARLDYYRTARDGVNQLYCVQVATTAAPTAARCRCPGYQDLFWPPLLPAQPFGSLHGGRRAAAPSGRTTQAARRSCGVPGPAVTRSRPGAASQGQ